MLKLSKSDVKYWKWRNVEIVYASKFGNKPVYKTARAVRDIFSKCMRTHQFLIRGLGLFRPPGVDFKCDPQMLVIGFPYHFLHSVNAPRFRFLIETKRMHPEV